MSTNEAAKPKSLNLTGKIVRVSDVAQTKQGTNAVHGSIIVEGPGGKDRDKNADVYHQFSAYGKAALAFADRKPGAWIAVSYTTREEKYQTKAGADATKTILVVSSARFAKAKTAATAAA